ncbi:protein of unknown function [Candidatus Promineifilum breve]|uniref:Uncharacterized protein n=1 Tax=Candidatus Promineifilum breve TaxID=1806508 RepID=A0A160T9I8_9CHLR|nr:protein of unknown function [Candidatus Promineifilum breve]
MAAIAHGRRGGGGARGLLGVGRGLWPALSVRRAAGADHPDRPRLGRAGRRRRSPAHGRHPRRPGRLQLDDPARPRRLLPRLQLRRSGRTRRRGRKCRTAGPGLHHRQRDRLVGVRRVLQRQYPLARRPGALRPRPGPRRKRPSGPRIPRPRRLPVARWAVTNWALRSVDSGQPAVDSGQWAAGRFRYRYRNRYRSSSVSNRRLKPVEKMKRIIPHALCAIFVPNPNLCHNPPHRRKPP